MQNRVYIMLLASEPSERDSGVDNAKSGIICYNWRASVASETLTGVKMKKSGMFVYWRGSVASETVLGVDNAKSGICYIYVQCIQLKEQTIDFFLYLS